MCIKCFSRKRQNDRQQTHHYYYERSSYHDDHSPHSSPRSSHSHHSSPEHCSPRSSYSSYSNSAQRTNANQSSASGCNRRRRSSVDSWQGHDRRDPNSTDTNDANDARDCGTGHSCAASPSKKPLVHRKQQQPQQGVEKLQPRSQEICKHEHLQHRGQRQRQQKSGPHQAGGRARGDRAASAAAGAAAATGLMSCCVQNTASQARQMHIGTDCGVDNPYAGLTEATFGKLLKATRSPPRSRFKARRKKRKKLRLCKAKRPGECDTLQLRLCPRLGIGHTHEQLIEEVTPVLLRSAQNVNCQLTEICRRIVFMQQNIPHMTSPELARFQAIMARITRMLIADFSSFPEGLRLPQCKQKST